MKTITKEVKVVSLTLKGFFGKAKAFISKVGGKIKDGIDIAVDYIHEKIDQFERWLYVKLEAKFADKEAGLEVLTDEITE